LFDKEDISYKEYQQAKKRRDKLDQQLNIIKHKISIDERIIAKSPYED